jgi:hypothetical protein
MDAAIQVVAGCRSGFNSEQTKWLRGPSDCLTFKSAVQYLNFCALFMRSLNIIGTEK